MAAKGTKKQIPKDKDYIPQKPRDVSKFPSPNTLLMKKDMRSSTSQVMNYLAKQKKQAHAQKLTMTDSDSDGSNTVVTTAVISKKASKIQAKVRPKKKRRKKTHAKHSKTTASAETMNVDISSEDESDGQGALRAVEEAEEQLRGGSKRGPQSRTRIHWHTPCTTLEPGTRLKHWLFKC
ncbi:hypothetical protein C8R48DRAFT_772424 [Suillus tomentosus]|nr:hypothetical protein C8R48DRAFT_772424 [Suillus tomentosus]